MENSSVADLSHVGSTKNASWRLHDDLAPTTYAENMNTSGNSTPPGCPHYHVLIEMWFVFDTYQLVRVILTWALCFLSASGNLFVLFSLRPTRRAHHYIMFHLALADLAYACFVLPTDAVWNTTMQWFTGDAVCKLAQMLKQFGMYSSSFMVVVIGVDRVTAILYPLTAAHQRKIAVYLVSTAWVASVLCTIPAGVLFSILRIPTCEGIEITQCVDNLWAEKRHLNSYHFFTMIASFLLPLLSTIISYSLIVCEISKMKARDRELMGRRNSANTLSMQKAIKKTILMRTLITLSFLLCWGPYYAKGIVDWFIRDISQPETSEHVSRVSYLVMYLNCLLHPIVFGIFLKEVRDNFSRFFKCCSKVKAKENVLISKSSRASETSVTTNTMHFAQSGLNNNNGTQASEKLSNRRGEPTGPIYHKFTVAEGGESNKAKK